MPGGGGEKGEILPTKLQTTTVFYESVAFPGEHAEKEVCLHRWASGEGDPPEPCSPEFISPSLYLHLARALGAADCDDVADL